MSVPAFAMPNPQPLHSRHEGVTHACESRRYGRRMDADGTSSEAAGTTPLKQKRAEKRAPAPPKVTTPWGAAALVEELVLNQRAGEQKFASLVQLLELPRGERLVRFAYSTGGTARRGPVTLRKRDLDRLRTALAARPGLAQALGFAQAPRVADEPSDGAP